MKKTENEVQAVEEIAHDVYSWAQSAVGDLAGCDEILADDYWDDEDVLSDLFGDRIFDESCHLCGSSGDEWRIAFVLICDKIKANNPSHKAMVKAMDRLMERHLN